MAKTKLYYAHIANQKIEVKEYVAVDRGKTYQFANEFGLKRNVYKEFVGKVDSNNCGCGWGTSADEALEVLRASVIEKAMSYEREASNLRNQLAFSAVLVDVNGNEHAV